MPEPLCPICHRPTAPGLAPRLAPFCSQRCADVDLGRWVTGQYVVAGAEGEADEEALDPADGFG